jgi:hypothetical protein
MDVGPDRRIAMAPDRRAVLAIPAAATLLLWPALWNGYPIVFADTGTYLSQAIHRYAGWDRPVFYSLFMLPLHATVTVWPVVVAQALLTVWVLWLVCRALLPWVCGIAFVAGVAVLSAFTWLPWIVCELMPDLFTPLLILVVCLLAWVQDRLSRREQMVLVGMAAFMIASQQSSLPLAFALLAIVFGLRCVAAPHPGTRQKTRTVRWRLVVLPPALAVMGLCTVNLAAHGRFAISPFGNIFLLARVIYDGPGMAILRRDCPTAHWRLCPFLDAFPPTSDDFLWTPDSPLNRAGGPKLVSQDADAIIQAALFTDPLGEAHAVLSNTWAQLGRFDSGDGLEAWPMQVSPTIAHDFPPRERMAYSMARQQIGQLSVPRLLAEIHWTAAIGGVVVSALLLPLAFKRRSACAGFLLCVLLALPFSAAITGGLSAPHDRYQARIMWLPSFVAAV